MEMVSQIINFTRSRIFARKRSPRGTRITLIRSYGTP
jgi:hypothetical protein